MRDKIGWAEESPEQTADDSGIRLGVKLSDLYGQPTHAIFNEN